MTTTDLPDRIRTMADTVHARHTVHAKRRGAVGGVDGCDRELCSWLTALAGEVEEATARPGEKRAVKRKAAKP